MPLGASSGGRGEDEDDAGELPCLYGRAGSIGGAAGGEEAAARPRDGGRGRKGVGEEGRKDGRVRTKETQSQVARPVARYRRPTTKLLRPVHVTLKWG